jgi:hypothetical protein
MEKKPLDSPRDNALDDWLARLPIVLYGIVDAKSGKIGSMVVAVNVLRRLACSTWVDANRRFDDKYTDVWIPEVPVVELAAREINDADAIGLADGPQGAFPHRHPTAVCGHSELRALRPQLLILFGDRQRQHRGYSPQGLLFGVERAVVGTAAEPRAGILPVPRMWNPLPVSLSRTC